LLRTSWQRQRRRADEEKEQEGVFFYDERHIRHAYGGLWRIEQPFRILKSYLYARPVFAGKNEHIRARFPICFAALLIIRIIQRRMWENALSAERISRAL